MSTRTNPALEAAIPFAPPFALEEAKDVAVGLSNYPKKLPAWLFYDERGSQLFEQITSLPEYYLTRTERAILATHADDIVAAASSDKPLTILELGAGTAEKTGLLIEAVLRQQSELVYCPLDVSSSALDEASERLTRHYAQRLRVQPEVCEYTRAIGPFPAEPGTRRMVLWIGSSMGNFTPTEASEILKSVRERLSPGDSILLGLDLIKEERILLDAYDDAAGVTAAFNLNMLARLNQNLEADFDLESFEHVACWNGAKSRMEMHLVSQQEQTISIAALGKSFQFVEGESIHTENSHKYSLDSAEAILTECGFLPDEHWLDEQGWFTVMLARVV